MVQRAVISGIYATPAGKLPGSTCMSLHAQAALGALVDAGLSLDDVDGVLCAYSFTEPHQMLSSIFAEYIGLQPNYSASISAGGATACLMVMTAKALVENGTCRHILLATGDNRLTGMPPGGAVAALAHFGHRQFEVPYGMTVPACYALVAQRYMHEYGLTRDQLSAVSVTQRRQAGLHPGAQFKNPITVEEVSTSRLIASPLRLLDCAPVSDGGAAVLVSAAEEVAQGSRAVPILGAGQKHTHEHIMAAPSLTRFGCRQSSATAFEQAGVTPQEIDVAEIYDSFTITLLVELESIGFFPKGQAGQAAASGELGLGGRLPCNTHGGLLSYGHPGPAGGMYHIVEAVTQLRGEAAGRQVKDARLAFVHGDGGILSAHCSLVLGK
ncbi:MAG: thiolase family protein [Thermodesulfobacteriota bacterium]